MKLGKYWNVLAKFSKLMVDILGFGAAITGSLVCMHILDYDKIIPDPTKPQRTY